MSLGNDCYYFNLTNANSIAAAESRQHKANRVLKLNYSLYQLCGREVALQVRAKFLTEFDLSSLPQSVLDDVQSLALTKQEFTISSTAALTTSAAKQPLLVDTLIVLCFKV